MKNYDIEFLQSEQENIDQRRAQLLEQYRVFRKSFLGRIEEFTRSAVKSKIEAVKEFKRVVQEKDYIEAVCTLNGVDLNLVGSNHVIPLDVFSGVLATKILIYTDDGENSEPYLQVIYHEAPSGEYRYELVWQADEIRLRLKDRGQGSAEGGIEAAEILMEHLYSLRRHWTEQPSLKAVRDGKASVRSIGFILPNPPTSSEKAAPTNESGEK